MRSALYSVATATGLLALAACSDSSVPLDSNAPRFAAASPRVIPPSASPLGRPYREWSAAWWKWAWGTPPSISAVLDATGDRCASGQGDRVWFLAGSFSTDPVERHCTIPVGRPLLFPIINVAWGAFLNDPPETRTEEFMRAQLTCVEAAELAASIDGVPVTNLKQYLEKSILFDVQLPADNVLGLTADVVPQLLLSPTVDEGYYLIVMPLAPGSHTLRWSAAACGFTQDITYHLTVR